MMAAVQWKPLWGVLLINPLVAVPCFRGNLAAEEAIRSNEINQSDGHAHRPPDESDVQRVRTGEGAGDGDVARRIARGRQQRRIESDGGADEHENQIEA